MHQQSEAVPYVGVVLFGDVRRLLRAVHPGTFLGEVPDGVERLQIVSDGGLPVDSGQCDRFEPD